MLAIITCNGASLVDPAYLKSIPNSFPASSSLECSTSAWSANSSDLYLATGPSIKRYTPSECLLEELYHGSDTVTCMQVKDKSTTLFFAAANKVWSLDCAYSPGRLLSPLGPHKNTITMISISNDGTLLASVSDCAVLVHDLAQSSHVQLKGLPDKTPVNSCLFHQHSRTKLLLGVGRDLVIYDSMRPSGPLKIVRIPGGGGIVGMTSSPFSKTLIAAVTQNGDVVLVDLDKDSGVVKTVNVKIPLSCCAFTAEGAAIYLGTGNGKLLVLDLRSLEKEPKSFNIGDGDASIKAIVVQRKSKSRLNDATGTKVKSSSIGNVKSSLQHSASSTRTSSTGSVTGGARVNLPGRGTVASRIRGASGVTPKKKLLSLVRSPLSETKNLDLEARIPLALSPALSRNTKHLRPQKSNESEGNTENTGQRTKISYKIGQDIEHLGLGSAPESISVHLAAMRTRSGTALIDTLKDQGGRPKASRRVNSESTKTDSNEHKYRSTSSVSTKNKVSSLRGLNGVIDLQRKDERRLATPDNGDVQLDLNSSELPREPVTPISLGKNAKNVPLANATDTGVGVLGLASPEVAKWVRGESRTVKGKEKAVEAKKTRFVQHPESRESSRGSDNSEDEGGPDIRISEQPDGEREELSLQVSPRRQTAPPGWLRSPHRSSEGLNMNTAAQDFLRNIVHDVMYDFQRETKAEMMGLHLDLVRMGRGWKQELREVMEEWSGEIQELRAENKRLKEENERLRRGY